MYYFIFGLNLDHSNNIATNWTRAFTMKPVCTVTGIIGDLARTDDEGLRYNIIDLQVATTIFIPAGIPIVLS